MSKRFTDTTIWKKQRWFRQLTPVYKLAFKYLTDECDNAGLWKIDFNELLDDLGLDEFDLEDFIACCNSDNDKLTGKKIQRERILLVNEEYLWLTGFIKFQYESRDHKVKPAFNMAKSALERLAYKDLFQYALDHNFFALSEPFRTLPNPSEPPPRVSNPTGKGKGKGNTVFNSTIVQKEMVTNVTTSDAPHLGVGKEKKENGKNKGREKQPEEKAPQVAPAPPEEKLSKAERRKQVLDKIKPLIKNIYLSWHERHYGVYVWEFGKCDKHLHTTVNYFLNYALEEFRGTDPADQQVIERARNLFDDMLQNWEKIKDNFYISKTDICKFSTHLNHIKSLQNSYTNGTTNAHQQNLNGYKQRTTKSTGAENLVEDLRQATGGDFTIRG